MTVTRYVVRRKSDGLYNMSAHGWTPDITQASLFVDEHLAHMMFDEIKDVIPVRVTIEEAANPAESPTMEIVQLQGNGR